MKKDIVAILAGNAEQAKAFLEQKELWKNEEEPTEYVYIDRPDKAIGYRFFDYKIIGTFWDREDASKLEEIVKSRII